MSETALILSIETSTAACSIALHNAGEVLSEQTYFLDKSHSALLPGIINDMLNWSGYSLNDLVAIAVSSGPGSYTGLRIGLSTVKGLCYSLDLPLIQISSLDTLALAGRDWSLQGTLICPMIDARRMEVYTKLIDHEGLELWPTQALVLTENTFEEFEGQILLVGNGATKCRGFLRNSKLIIADKEVPQARHMGTLAWNKFQADLFEDLASYEPNYLKEFQTKKAKNKLQ